MQLSAVITDHVTEHSAVEATPGTKSVVTIYSTISAYLAS